MIQPITIYNSELLCIGCHRITPIEIIHRLLAVDLFIKQLTMNYRNNLRDQSPGVLSQYLSKPDFPLQQLLAIPNIISDIKNDIPNFVKYLSTRGKLTRQLIYYATRLTESQLEQELSRKYCFVAIQILCNQDEELVALFFKTKPGDSEEIEEEITANQEMELLLSGDEEVIPDGNDHFEPEEMLKYLMDYLFEGDIENSIQNNYFSKIVISLIRKTGNNFMAFMISHPEYLGKIIENIHSLSLGTIMIKLLIIDTEECQEAGVTQAQCKEYKLEIVKKLKEIYFSRLDDLEFCESIELLVYEGFQSVKSKYFQFPEDLVMSFNLLVNQQTIHLFLSKMLSTTNQNQLISLSIVLTQIVRKYNREIQEYYDNQVDKKNLKEIAKSDFILRFEIDEVIECFQQFIKVLSKGYFQTVSNLNKHRFTTLLIEIMKLNGLWSTELRFEELIPTVLGLLSGSVGVLQNDYFIIAKTLIEKCPQSVLEAIPFEALELAFDKQEQDELKTVNNSINFGPKLSLLLQIDSKRSNRVLGQHNERVNEVLDRYRVKHSHVLGGSEPQTKTHKWSDYSQQSPIFSNSKDQVSLGEINNRIQMVGKLKNIAIPNLRYMNEIKNTKSDKSDEEFEPSMRDEKLNIIQVQEEEIVIVLEIPQQRLVQSIPTRPIEETKVDPIAPEINRKVEEQKERVVDAVTETKDTKVKQKDNEVERPGQFKEKNRQLISFYSSLYMII